MARCEFGGGSADFVMAASNGGFIKLSAATLYVWTTQVGGSQITDLQLNGAPVTVVPVGSDGQVPVFLGPNDGTSEVWVTAGPTGPRTRLTSGVTSATDAVVSGLVGNPATATGGALSSTYASLAVDATQGVIAKIVAGLVDVDIQVVGDSTTAEPGRWVGKLATALGAKFPTHSVVIHQFNISGTLAYDAPTTIATGSGPRTIHIWNAAIGGHSTMSWKGAKGAAAFDGRNPDLTLMSLGHNEGAVAVADRWHQQMVSLTEDLTQRSDTAFIIISQNPQTESATPGAPSIGEQEARREVYRNIAAHRGFGFIDVCQAFLDTGDPAAITVDGTHPNTTGYQLWADTVMQAFNGTHKKGAPRPQQPSCFTVAGPTLIRNGTFESGLAHWKTSGATAVIDATHSEVSAVKITNTGAGAGYLYQDLVASRVAGRWVTVAARMYVPAGTVDSAGLVAIDDSTGSTTTTGHPHGKDGFRWDVVTRFIPAGATTPRVKIYASSVTSTDSVWCDRVVLVEGRWPRGAFRADAGGEWLTYTPALSSNITLGSGSIVATYRQDPLSKTVEMFARITLAADSTVNGSVATTVSLPVNVLSSPSAVIAARATLTDSGTPYLGIAYDAGTHDKLTVRSIGTAGIGTNLSGTSPFTWATGDVIEVAARYRYA